MINNDLTKPGLSRRDLLSTAAAATGALVVGFWMPQRAPAQIINPEGAAWAINPAVEEINAWVVVAPDDTVLARIKAPIAGFYGEDDPRVMPTV